MAADALSALFLWLIGQSYFVSWLVDLFKRSKFIEAHPKLIAALLNAVGVTLADLVVDVPAEVSGFIAALIAAFLGSVGSHEVNDAVFRRKKEEARL